MTTCLPWEQTRGAKRGYVANSDHAGEMMEQGKQQSKCRTCGRWYWPDERDEHVAQQA